MEPEIEIVGGASTNETAAVVAAVQALIAEAENAAAQARRVSSWSSTDHEAFETGEWAVVPDEDEKEPPPPPSPPPGLKRSS